MARKLCNICNTRPVDSAAGISGACVPCYEEGGWENAHQDNNHNGLTEVLRAVMETEKDRTGADVYKIGAVELRKVAQKAKVKNAAKFKSAELRAEILRTVEVEQAGCWICHPELNEAQKVSKTRAPSIGEKKSRVGQKINVPLRAPGELKAAVVERAAVNLPVQVSSNKDGSVTLDITTPTFVMVLAWDRLGRYDYDRSVASVNGKAKKVRNVAEALRLLTEA
jgi:hypothetical protein